MININLKQQVVLGLKYPRTTINYLKDKLWHHRKVAPFPRLLNCFITERCNFKCPMCHVAESRHQKMAELAFADFKKVIDESKEFAPSFQLSGGEPLLHSEIIRIIEYISENKMVKGLVTNGLLLEEKAEALVEAGLDFLAISLDGPDEKTQYRRGYVKGSFAKIIQGVKKVVKVRGRKLFPNIRIATVVSPINLDNFDQVLKVAEAIGADQWSLSHYFYCFDQVVKLQKDFAKKYWMGEDVWGDNLGRKKELFNRAERKKIEQKYLKIRRLVVAGKVKVRVNFQENVNIEKYYSGAFPSASSSCRSPYHQLFIRGNGEAEICQGYILGNVKKDKIKDLWHGQKVIHFRRVFEKTGVMPACFRCCALEIKFD